MSTRRGHFIGHIDATASTRSRQGRRYPDVLGQPDMAPTAMPIRTGAGRTDGKDPPGRPFDGQVAHCIVGRVVNRESRGHG